MATSLDQFMTQLANGGQVRSTNMFEMEVYPGPNAPGEVQAFFDASNVNKFTMYGQGFSVPSRTIEYGEVAFKGFTVGNAVPLKITMENEHTVTLYADTNGELRRAFLAWSASIIDPAISQGSLFAGYRDTNSGSLIRIKLLGNDMETPLEIYKMVNIKVGNVGALTVSNTDASVSTFEVSFKSSYWELETVNGMAGGFTDQK